MAPEPARLIERYNAFGVAVNSVSQEGLGSIEYTVAELPSAITSRDRPLR